MRSKQKTGRCAVGCRAPPLRPMCARMGTRGRTAQGRIRMSWQRVRSTGSKKSQSSKGSIAGPTAGVGGPSQAFIEWVELRARSGGEDAEPP